MKQHIAQKIAEAKAKPKAEYRGMRRKPSGRKPGQHSKPEALKCTCGQCNVCRTRQRIARAVEGTHEK